MGTSATATPDPRSENVPETGDVRGATSDRGASATTPEALFRDHAPYVARVALRVLGRGPDVDDVVQEVFLAALRGADAIRDPGAARAWLASITVRKARAKLYTRRLRAAIGLDDAPDYEGLVAGDGDPEERVLLARVYAALDKVPTEERLAWTLRVVEGEALEHVAALCGCSLATAKRRVVAAHARIRREVGDG